MSANSLRSGYSPAARLGEWTHRRRIVNAGQPVDLDELDRWVSTGCVRRREATLPYGPTLLEARDAGISSIAVSALGVVSGRLKMRRPGERTGAGPWNVAEFMSLFFQCSG